MRQRPEGPNGELTAEQRRRAAYYAINTMAATLGDDDEKTQNLLDKMKLGFRTVKANVKDEKPE